MVRGKAYDVVQANRAKHLQIVELARELVELYVKERLAGLVQSERSWFENRDERYKGVNRSMFRRFVAEYKGQPGGWGAVRHRGRPQTLTDEEEHEVVTALRTMLQERGFITDEDISNEAKNVVRAHTSDAEELERRLRRVGGQDWLRRMRQKYPDFRRQRSSARSGASVSGASVSAVVQVPPPIAQMLPAPLPAQQLLEAVEGIQSEGPPAPAPPDQDDESRRRSTRLTGKRGRDGPSAPSAEPLPDAKRHKAN